MSTLTTLILIASGIVFDPNAGSELMVTTKNCLVGQVLTFLITKLRFFQKEPLFEHFQKKLRAVCGHQVGRWELGTFKHHL